MTPRHKGQVKRVAPGAHAPVSVEKARPPRQARDYGLLVGNATRTTASECPVPDPRVSLPPTATGSRMLADLTLAACDLHKRGLRAGI